MDSSYIYVLLHLKSTNWMFEQHDVPFRVQKCENYKNLSLIYQNLLKQTKNMYSMAIIALKKNFKDV